MHQTPGSATRVDVIGEVLRSIHLEGTVYFEAQVEAPWGIHIPDNGVANFHLITAGSCFVDVADGSSVHLLEGDAVVFPHGLAHTLGHEPGHPGLDGGDLFDRMDDAGVVRLPNQGGQKTTLICGHFSYDDRLGHPLLEALPPVIHAAAGHHPGWKTVAEMAVERSRRLSPGSRALTDRLAEVLVIELLSDHSAEDPGFVAALSDPAVAAALHAIHERPEEDWTVTELAKHVSVSRSTLATRFTEMVGESPIRYLTRWRMHRAALLLRETDRSAGEVGYAIGYRSPFAFTRAFTREFGLPPTAYRNGSSQTAQATTERS